MAKSLQLQRNLTPMPPGIPPPRSLDAPKQKPRGPPPKPPTVPIGFRPTVPPTAPCRKRARTEDFEEVDEPRQRPHLRASASSHGQEEEEEYEEYGTDMPADEDYNEEGDGTEMPVDEEQWPPGN